MKTFYVGLMVTGLLVTTGCNTSTTGGTPGVGTFKLKGPSNVKDTELKHDSEKIEKITVDADKGFKEDITFKAEVSESGKGVTAEVKPPTLKASDPREVELHIKASDSAAPGEYTITVTGKPAKGNETSVGVKVKVPEKSKK
jgi:hypothetical protein